MSKDHYTPARLYDGSGHSVLSIVPVNGADDVLHAAIGLAGIAAGLATASQSAGHFAHGQKAGVPAGAAR